MLESFEAFEPDIDPAAYVHAAAVVIGQVKIGPESTVWPAATVRGDDGPIVIGAQTSIQDGAVLHNTEGLSVTTVGDRVTVGHQAILHGCTVEDDCIIGMGSIVLDNAVIERHCIIGAGALVPPGKRIASGSVVIGSPAKVMRACTDQDLEWIEHSWKEYVTRCQQYRARDGR